jgi:hypothetical protein
MTFFILDDALTDTPILVLFLPRTSPFQPPVHLVSLCLSDVMTEGGAISQG